jgi:hypothetical protein
MELHLRNYRPTFNRAVQLIESLFCVISSLVTLKGKKRRICLIDVVQLYSPCFILDMHMSSLLNQVL